MYRKSLNVLKAVLFIGLQSSLAQAPVNMGCKLPANFFYSKFIGSAGHGATSAMVPPPLFPLVAKDTCGKFILFYEDIRLASLSLGAAGFADPTNGVTRRNTLCAVLSKIQATLDFSKIPNNEYIRLFIDTSISAIFPAPLGSWWLGTGSAGTPFFKSGLTAGDTVNGFVHDFITKGVDPMPGDYHGTLRVNFYLGRGGTPVYFGTYDDLRSERPLVWNEDMGEPSNCEFDLASTLIHSVAHLMGWFSWRDYSTHGVPGGSYYTNYELKIHAGPPVGSIPNPLAGSLLYPLGTGPLPSGVSFWLNGMESPNNLPLNGNFSHLSTEGFHAGMRTSPGEMKLCPMQYSLYEGVKNRDFSKAELEAFRNNLGYDYNPTFIIDSAVLLNNNAPWSSKMSHHYYNSYEGLTFTETVPADFTITNNIGASLSINLSTDTTLKDADGDSISVYPGSLFNIRGCGNGGNNHVQLSLSANKKIITFTPRANFYGKAIFGLNLWDGKTKGAYVIYTIQVSKGDNVTVAPGANMVQNGNFEEGTEVKIRNTADSINNTANYYYSFIKGRFQNGLHCADGQYYPNGTAIQNSYVECREGLSSVFNYGSVFQTFPYPYGPVHYSYGSGTFNYPKEKDSTGSRYETHRKAGLYFLNDTLKKCQRYLLEMDVYRTWADTFDNYPPSQEIRLGFTSDQYLDEPYKVYLIQRNPVYNSKKLRTRTWEHIKVPFTYCSDTPSTVMYLYLPTTIFPPDSNSFAPLLLDNLSLRVYDSLQVVIADSAIGKCQRRLYADMPDMGCPMSYKWTKQGSSTIVGTGSYLDVINSVNESYILSVSDGCSRISEDTFEISPCPCSIGAVFGATKDSLLPSASSASLSAGIYHLTTDMTITGSPTFTNALILIEPDIQITIANNAQLTLDHCHLFTCPDSTKLWKGIKLASTGSGAGGTSARIEVMNNTLIEDAYIAIDAQYIKVPASGDIIKVTNSIFNRNGVDININNGYTLGAAGKYPITITGNLFTARLFNSSNMSGYPDAWASSVSLKALTTPDDATANYVISKNYPKAYRKDGIFSYLCVQVQNVGTTFGGGSSFAEVEIGGGSSIADLNLYDNHRYGIHSNNTNSSIYNSAIINISKRMVPSSAPHSVTLPDWGGGGVVARSSTPVSINRVRIIKSASGNLINRFFDCWGAVYVERLAYFTLTDAEITSSHRLGLPTPGAAYPTELYRGTAVELRDSVTLINWTIHNNTISNMNAGIYAWLQNTKAGASINIKYNKFYAENPGLGFAPYTSDQYQLQAVEVYSPTGIGKSTLNIDSNTMNRVFSGVYCNGLKATKANVQFNNINLWDVTTSSSNPQYGIKMESCTEALVSGNTISTASLSSTGDRINGVYAAFNTSLSVCNNKTDKIGRGFSFAQKTPQAGTRWILNTMKEGYKGFVLGSDIGDQGLMYNWVTMSPLTYWAATGNKWTGTWSMAGSKYQTVGMDSVSTLKSKLYVKNITGATAEKPTINFAIPTSASPFKYFDSLGFGSILLPAVSNLPDANCIGGAFPTKTVHTTFPKGVKSLAFMIMSDSIGYGSEHLPNQWMAQMALYELGILEPYMRDSVGTFDSFMVAAAGSRFAWLSSIETALANGNNSQAQALLNSPTPAMGRVVISPDVIITDYTEANSVVNNYKDFYAIYLRYLTNSMTATDTANIAALAAQCPARDGAAVYKARGLYRLLSGIVATYHDDDCLYGNGGQYQLALGTEGTEPDNGYVLYPNPNEGTFSIQLKTSTDKQVSVKVYNTIGMMIAQEKGQFNHETLNFKLQNAHTGLYFICLTDEQNKTTCLKFNIR